MTELLRRIVCRAAERRRALLLPARDPDRRRAIADVPAKLAPDGRDGIRRERNAPAGVEAARCGDEPDGGDLHEIVERLAAPGEAAGERMDERQVPVDEILDRI